MFRQAHVERARNYLGRETFEKLDGRSHHFYTRVFRMLSGFHAGTDPYHGCLPA